METKTKKYYDDLVKTARGSRIDLLPFPESLEDIISFFEKEYEASGKDSSFIAGVQEAISYHKQSNPRMTKFELNDVRRAFNTFITKVLPLENDMEAEVPTNKQIKLQWVGANNQLYSVL